MSNRTSFEGQQVRRAKMLGFLCILFICVGVLVLFWKHPFPLLQRFENATWDLRVKATARRAHADSRIKIITIDQHSLDSFAADDVTWPTPREFYARVIRFLKRGGARGLAIDMLFTDPSRFGVEDDQTLAEATKLEFPSVFALALNTSPRETDLELLKNFSAQQRQQQSSTEAVQQKISLFGENALPSFEGITLPLQELVIPNAVFGNVTHKPAKNEDGIFRHAQIGGRFLEFSFFNLPFALCALTDCQSKLPLIAAHVKGRGQLPIRFHGPEGTYPSFSFAEVVRSEFAIEQGEKPRIDPQTFKGSWVFLGVTALGLVDFHPSPIDPKFPGVEQNATIFDNVLNDNFIRIPPLGQIVFLSLLFCALAAGGTIFPRRFRNQLLFSSLSILVFLWLGFRFAHAGYWFPLVRPGIAILLASSLGFLLQYQLEGRQNRFVQKAFRQYVSPAVMEHIVADPSKLQLGGEKRELTILFSDVASFTSISEKLEPQDLLSFMNEYLGEMTEIILRFGGTLDKYIGDAIVAFWNAPLDTENHAICGVSAALECQERLGRLRVDFEKTYGIQVRSRIGINTGAGVVGNFGSEVRFDYTVLGDNVNLAARLEGVNKYFGTSILMTQETYNQCRDEIFARRVGAVRVVGKEKPVTIWEPIAQAKESRTESFEQYYEALAHFEAGRRNEALVIFQQLSAEDSVAQAYVKRIQSETGKDEISAEWVLTEK